MTTERTEPCKHEAFATHAAINFLEDTRRWYVDFTITCATCGTPFHFITPHYGLLVDQPAASPDATELRCPIAPGAGILSTSARFEVPSATRPQES